MPIERKRWDALSDFLPEGTLPLINQLLLSYNVKLIVTMPRNSVLGYYKPPHRLQRQHVITINKNLNKYKFLMVLLHEIAHMNTHVIFGRKAKPHGVEWQREFSRLLGMAYELRCFPSEVQKIVHKRILFPTVLRSCMDVEMMRALRSWDNDHGKADWILVEEVPIGGLFEDTKGRRMQLLKKQRSRFLCKQVNTVATHYFLYPGVMEVKPIRVVENFEEGHHHART